jgi:hypothetical protein
MARLSSILLLLLLTGCAPRTPTLPVSGSEGQSADIIAPGVFHRAIPTGSEGGIDLIDVDLAHTSARIAVAAEDIKRVDGLVTGRAYTPHEWLDKAHALAAVNGGYFGQEVGVDRNEIAGLLVQDGKVRRAMPPLHGHGSVNARAGRYVHSAFGLSAQGRPDIEWAATDPAAIQSVQCYAAPDGPLKSSAHWSARTIVGCGPTLLRRGKIFVTDRQERLVNPSPEARTFVAYDGPAGVPRHFVMGMAYFPRYDKTRPGDAMCLDGGSSTQLSYRLKDGTVQSPRETGATVPDAVLILPG